VVRLLIALLCCSCGYHFTRPGGDLPEGVQKVHAAVFLNKTPEPGAEAIFTQSLREQLLRAGRLEDSSLADAEIKGTLESVTGSPLLLEPNRLPTYRLNATVTLKLMKGERELTRAVVSGTDDYLGGADVLLTESNRQAALHRLSDTLMREGFERLASTF
jgi:hypothetical protein